MAAARGKGCETEKAMARAMRRDMDRNVDRLKGCAMAEANARERTRVAAAGKSGATAAALIEACSPAAAK